jgi:hypothetical protein
MRNAVRAVGSREHLSLQRLLAGARVQLALVQGQGARATARHTGQGDGHGRGMAVFAGGEETQHMRTRTHRSSRRTPRADGDPFGLYRGAEGLITGTVVCAAALAYGAGHLDTTATLCMAILGTVLVYWLAHLHAETLGDALTHGHHPLQALRHAVAGTWLIAGVSVLPVAILLLAELLGADLSTAAWIALIATIALLTVYSYLAGARGGLGISGRLTSAAAGAGLGILVALLKVALH